MPRFGLLAQPGGGAGDRALRAALEPFALLRWESFQL